MWTINSKPVVYNKAIKLTGDHIFYLGVENEQLRGRLGKVDEKWLGESKNRIKLSYDDVRKNSLFYKQSKDKPKH